MPTPSVTSTPATSAASTKAATSTKALTSAIKSTNFSLTPFIQLYLKTRMSQPRARMYQTHVDAVKFASKYVKDLVDDNLLLCKQFAEAVRQDNDIMMLEYYWENIGKAKGWVKEEERRRAREKEEAEWKAKGKGKGKVEEYEWMFQEKGKSDVKVNSDSSDSDDSIVPAPAPSSVRSRSPSPDPSTSTKDTGSTEEKQRVTLLDTTRLRGPAIKVLIDYTEADIDALGDEEVRKAFDDLTEARNCVRECNKKLKNDLKKVAVLRDTRQIDEETGKVRWNNEKREKVWKAYWEEFW